MQRRKLGGGMRQAGVIAAAGIVALETMVQRLADDHARARVIAEKLAERWPGSVDPALIHTNIVCARLDALPERFIEQLGTAGVRVGTVDPRTVRFVTHKDVDDDALARRSRRSTPCDPADVADADVPERVLAIYAHPDDPEISAGGTLRGGPTPAPTCTS